MQPLTGELQEEAFALAAEVFVESSTLHRALGIGLEEYRNYLRQSFAEMLAEDLSVAAVDEKSGRLSGCLIATDFAGQFTAQREPSGRFAPLAALTAALCDQYGPAPNPGQAMLVDMGAVLPGYAGHGVYKQLRKAVEVRARNRGFQTIIGELSSAATQHVILNRLGHRKVAEISFASFEHDGGFPFAAITEPASIVLAEGVL